MLLLIVGSISASVTKGSTAVIGFIVSNSTSSVIKGATVVVLLEYLGFRVLVVVVLVSFSATD